MKRNKFIILIALLCCSFPSLCQRHIKGIKSIDAGYGVSKYGSYFHAGFVMYTDTKFYGKANAFYETGTIQSLKYSSLGLSVTGNYNLAAIRERFFINAQGGIVVSNDKLLNPINEYDDKGNVSKNDFQTLKYGVLAGLETEYFISDKFTIVLGWNQRLVFNSDYWGKYRWYAQTGIRINF